jgi:3-hydroxyacyl-CoA dehydrogenase/enoyl-CoA hydratase/3-hydroxybutyryl-CoA epimerase/enoyl-CoA isomerase
MGETLSKIRPTLNYGDFKEVDIVIEAVVKTPRSRQPCWRSGRSGEGRHDLASNTSTISITFWPRR